MLLLDELDRARNLVNQCFEKIGCKPFPVTIEFKDRFTARLGDATYNPKTGVGSIRLSTKLFERTSREERDNTVVHELCHLVQMKNFPKDKPHGRYWKYIHYQCGYEPKVYHHVDRTGLKRKVTRIKAKCGCPDGLNITKHLRTKILKGNMYRCNKCKCRVQL